MPNRVAVGALRGLNDTRMTLIYTAICFWADRLLSLLGASAFRAGTAHRGIWIRAFDRARWSMRSF